MPPTVADHYDAELRRHNERLRAATGIRSADRVLDVGCGAGQTTRDAARAAAAGSALGVDVSERLLERARERTAAEGLPNVTYELGDAQVHRFAPEQFDVVISRFGTMFFGDPVAAFSNIARATRPEARLVMLVWQGHDRNEWATAIDEALSPGAGMPAPPEGANPFSLAEPAVLESILGTAGFDAVDIAGVREPVFYGPDAGSAYEIVCSMSRTRQLLASVDGAAAALALARLRRLLAAHETGQGVAFDSRAWIVTAKRGRLPTP
jgi:SAM-dependent methyltransferase